MDNYCALCPNECNVNRNEKSGRCLSSNKLKIAKFYLHPFEEPLVSGSKGSGTVFFCGCGLRCVFCQNYEVSRNLRGKEITTVELADIFKTLEDMGAENINLVNPSHYVLQIIEALNVYKPNIPIVYNTHSYEKIETLSLINDYVDVYLPDLKFISPAIAKRYTGKENYFEYAEKAIKFMMQNKKAVFDGEILKQGVIVRHLILPLCTNDSVKVVKWFKENQEGGAFLSLMAQYTPFGEIENFPELQRRITAREYEKVTDFALNEGIENILLQEKESADVKFIPKWDF